MSESQYVGQDTVALQEATVSVTRFGTRFVAPRSSAAANNSCREGR